jgi:hypothetical protein
MTHIHNNQVTSDKEGLFFLSKNQGGLIAAGTSEMSKAKKDVLKRLLCVTLEAEKSEEKG